MPKAPVAHYVYDRQTGKISEEQIYGAGALEFTYNTKLGRLLSFVLFKRKFVSKIVSLKYKSKASRKMIPGFIKQYGIDLQGNDESNFASFNEFFTRKQNREICEDENAFIAPADSRLLAKKIQDGTVISVKGHDYTLEELLQSREEAEKYKNGVCLVFRLCPTDYHRYCFPDDGEAEETAKIKGAYDSVNTFFVSDRIHVTNYREKTILHTKHFGQMAYLEIGAMLIGKITPTFRCPGHFTKGQEKGYFEYGASTVVIVLEENVVKLDSDIAACSEKNIETVLKYGEKIGEKI